MSIGDRVSVTPVSEGSIQHWRVGFFLGWIFAVGILPWIIWWNPGGQPEHQFVMGSVQGLIIASIVSVILGVLPGLQMAHWAAVHRDDPDQSSRLRPISTA